MEFKSRLVLYVIVTTLIPVLSLLFTGATIGEVLPWWIGCTVLFGGYELILKLTNKKK